MQIHVATCIARQLVSDTRVFAVAVTTFWGPEEIELLVAEEARRRGYEVCDPSTITTLDAWHEVQGQNAMVDGMIGFLTPSLTFLMSAFSDSDPMAYQALNIAPLPIPAVESTADPFLNKPWCPDIFQQIVFGGGQKTYAIFDSGLCGGISGGFDPDVLATQHETKCLYTGDLFESARDVAPYLVDLTLTDASPSIFQRNFAKDIWGNGAAIVIRTDEDFESLWKHLRKFTRIRSTPDSDSWTYFRF